MEIEGQLALVDVQDNADSIAAASSSYELVSILPLVLMVVTTSGWIGDPLVTTVAAPSVSCPSTSRFISADGVISLVRSNDVEAASTFYINVISSTSDTRNSGKLPWRRWKMVDVLSVLKFRWQKSRKFVGVATETGQHV